MAFRFPAELVHEILAFLQHDPSALKNCSLVNKAWLLSSRAWLFRQLSFPALVNGVTTLNLDDLDGHDSVNLTLRFVRRLKVNGAKLPKRFGILAQPFLQAIFSNITDLNLSTIILPNVTYLADLICHCAALHGLTCNHLTFHSHLGDTNVRPSIENPIPKHLQRLKFQYTDTHDILTELVARAAANPISQLRITDLAIMPIKRRVATAVVWKNKGFTRHIQSLAFGYDDPETTSWCRDVPMVPYFDELKTLYVGRLVVGGQPASMTAGFLPATLQRLRAPKLERAVLELMVDRVGQLDIGGGVINWHLLDDVLGEGLIHPHLREVIFHITGGADLEGLNSMLGARLPRLRERGELSVRRDFSISL